MNWTARFVAAGFLAPLASLGCTPHSPEGVYECVESCPIPGTVLTCDRPWHDVCANSEEAARNLCNFCNAAVPTTCAATTVGTCTLPSTPIGTSSGLGCGAGTAVNCRPVVRQKTERSCSSPCSVSGPLADFATDFAIDIEPDPSTTFINLFQDGGATFVGQFVPRGSFYLNGGNCPGASCPIEVAGVDLVSTDTITAPDGRVFANGSLFNINRATGTVNHGSVRLSPGALQFTASVDQNGSRRVDTFANSSPLLVLFDVLTGREEL
mgnify:CR=1 FL=1